MGYATVCGIQDQEEPKVTIPLSQHTEMVRKIQMLEDQKQIDQLMRELEAEKDRYNELLCRLYKTEEKLKEVQSHESI